MAFFRRRIRGYHVDIQLTARLQPMHRGHVFEESLEDYLVTRHPGARVTGGGTMITADERIDGCGIDVFIPETSDRQQAVADILDGLRRNRAPIGSTVTVGDLTADVGVVEGLSIRFPTIVEPDSLDEENVAHSTSLDAVTSDIRGALGERLDYMSWQLHRDGSELYLYGPSASDMRGAIATVPSLRDCAPPLDIT